MTFLSGPNSVGNPVEIETPVPLGPRNCVQSSAATVTSDNDAIINAKGMYLIFDIEKSMRCYLVERSRVFNAVRWILVDGRRKRKEESAAACVAAMTHGVAQNKPISARALSSTWSPEPLTPLSRTAPERESQGRDQCSG